MMLNWWTDALDVREGLKYYWSLGITGRELKNRMECHAVISK